jgi:hypothetical protein
LNAKNIGFRTTFMTATLIGAISLSTAAFAAGEPMVGGAPM